MLRMLSEYVGEEDFLHGVSLYLKKHSYGNTVSADLWEGVAEATGMKTLLSLALLRNTHGSLQGRISARSCTTG